LQLSVQNHSNDFIRTFFIIDTGAHHNYLSDEAFRHFFTEENNGATICGSMGKPEDWCMANIFKERIVFGKCLLSDNAFIRGGLNILGRPFLNKFSLVTTKEGCHIVKISIVEGFGRGIKKQMTS
jgi:hypothetical protein